MPSPLAQLSACGRRPPRRGRWGRSTRRPERARRSRLASSSRRRCRMCRRMRPSAWPSTWPSCRSPSYRSYRSTLIGATGARRYQHRSACDAGQLEGPPSGKDAKAGVVSLLHGSTVPGAAMWLLCALRPPCGEIAPTVVIARINDHGCNFAPSGGSSTGHPAATGGPISSSSVWITRASSSTSQLSLRRR